jgi:hypothetical protein
MTLLIDTDLLNAAVDAVTAGLDALYFKGRTGSAPAALTDAATGTLLVSIQLADPAFGAAASGEAVSETVAEVDGSDSGTLGNFRLETSGGTASAQGAIGEAFEVTDWVKVSDSSATANLPVSHGLSSGSGFMVLWTGGGRQNCTAVISTNALTLSLGVGDAFPASATSGVKVGQGDMLFSDLTTSTAKKASIDTITIEALLG